MRGLLDPFIAARVLGVTPDSTATATDVMTEAFSTRLYDAVFERAVSKYHGGQNSESYVASECAALTVVEMILNESTTSDCAEERVLRFFLGGRPDLTEDSEGVIRSPAWVHEAAIPLAIDLFCDTRTSVAAITAGAAAWMLSKSREGWAAARARRMLGVVGKRFGDKT